MKRFSLLVAAAAIVSFSGAASAEQPEEPGCFGQVTADVITKLTGKEFGGTNASELGGIITKLATGYRESRDCPDVSDQDALVQPD